MNTFWQDLRYGIRMLWNYPGFTAASVICLALGIGATSAIFSIVNAVLLRPLPYNHSERMIRIYTEFPTFKKFWVSPPEFLDIQKSAKSWESIEGWVNQGSNLAGGNDPIRVTTSFVSGGLLSSLGVSPMMGRLITPQDDAPAAPLTAVLSYGFWPRAFWGDAGGIGGGGLQNSGKCTNKSVVAKRVQVSSGENGPAGKWAPVENEPAKPGST